MIQLYHSLACSQRLNILLHRHLLSHRHCCSSHKSQEMERARMSFSWCMEKESAVHVYDGILESEIMRSVGEWKVLENIMLDEVTQP